MHSKQCVPHQSEGVLPSFVLRLKLRFVLKVKKPKGKWRACRERAFGMAIMLGEFVRRDAG